MNVVGDAKVLNHYAMLTFWLKLSIKNRENMTVLSKIKHTSGGSDVKN